MAWDRQTAKRIPRVARRAAPALGRQALRAWREVTTSPADDPGPAGDPVPAEPVVLEPVATESIVTEPPVAEAVGPTFAQGRAFADSWTAVGPTRPVGEPFAPGDNPLWDYFVAHDEGPGIFKWDHYFEIYHRHLRRFVGRPVDMVEIGIFGGGSLEMWRSYLGEHAHIHGVDIEDACRKYERENISVSIGDQEDRAFWADFKREVPAVDIVLDDGGHTPAQQMVTLEELLPAMRPGGVYICEDVHAVGNQFTAYVAGLVDHLNHWAPVPEPDLTSPVTDFQRSVHSVHFYPFVVVIETHDAGPRGFIAPRHGTEWEPF